MRLIRSLTLAAALAAFAAPAAAWQPAAQDEFVPVSELPPEQELPAAPMVIAAYGFVWAALVVYLWTIVRRIQRVETDLAKLEEGPR